MMRRRRGLQGAALAGLVAALVVAGCTSGAMTSSQASAACGGFHLVIDNRGGIALDFKLNGQGPRSLAPGETTLYQWGPGGDLSAFPWTVEIIDPRDGTVLASRDVNAQSGDGAARIVISAPQGSAAGSAASRVGEVEPAVGC